SAFHVIGRMKRAVVLLFTDLLDEAAARPLLAAAPILARRHAVVLCCARDTDLDDFITRPANSPLDPFTAAVAGRVIAARDGVAARLERLGVTVVDVPYAALGSTCVRTYLRLKARARV